ncbi:hypothetical protein B0H13DRAFT_1881169 [Mycena leptocephala]|nr:hypothetical protein B0H13DRAFT_1881169 [Mycena leptocephala]
MTPSGSVVTINSSLLLSYVRIKPLQVECWGRFIVNGTQTAVVMYMALFYAVTLLAYAKIPESFIVDYRWFSVCHEVESWDRADSHTVEPRDRVQLWFNLEATKIISISTRKHMQTAQKYRRVQNSSARGDRSIDLMDPNRAEILGVRVCRIPPKWFHFPESLAKLIIGDISYRRPGLSTCSVVPSDAVPIKEIHWSEDNDPPGYELDIEHLQHRLVVRGQEVRGKECGSNKGEILEVTAFPGRSRAPVTKHDAKTVG